MRKIISLLFLIVFFSCKQEKKEVLPIKPLEKKGLITYAKGFNIEKSSSGITTITLKAPWPNASTSFKYALIPREKLAFITLNKDAYDAIVAVPIKRAVLTSTTHIPPLIALDMENTIVGFPNTNLVSSPKVRQRIEEGSIKELGSNELLNTEIVLELQPEIVFGFGINGDNKAYETIKNTNIPVVYNGDWTEQTPLGKAEWIKFFAPFYGKEKEADSIFATIEKAYINAKNLANKATQKPKVMTGGLYKDVWHVAGGKSWMAQFLNDANADYLWKETKETGSIPLSLEAVLSEAQEADIWFNPSLHTSYEQMSEASYHYEQFSAFKNKNIYSNTIKKGPTGGLLFYELSAQRPDIVLKDLITILHPEIKTGHQPQFFLPLQ